MFSAKTKVLIIDDSAVVRKALSSLLSRRKSIELVGMAKDAYEAKELIINREPEVLLLDIDMPRMDGITFLRILMRHHPMPVVVLSYLTKVGTSDAMDCINAGAVEVVGKPSNDQQLAGLADELERKLRNAAASKILPRERSPYAPLPKPSGRVEYHPRQLILLGASTGGTEALKDVLVKFSSNMPGILIVQHIPPKFSRAFAERLNRYCSLTVKEAEQGDIVRPGEVFVAPGDYHMTVGWRSGNYVISLNRGEPVWHQRPSVDVLFQSAVKSCGSNAVAAILTGMGKDGAEGLLKLRDCGASTLCQDEETSTVYGMPKAAMEIGAAQSQAPLWKLASAIEKAAISKTKAPIAK